MRIIPLRCRCVRLTIGVAFFTIGVLPVVAAPIVELSTASQTYIGKSVAHNDQVCWLADRDGSYRPVNLPQVTTFRKLPGDFQPLSATELKRELSSEYGSQYEIATRGNYVVCAPRGKARGYAELFDQVASSFSIYFSRRGFRRATPEFPLVALVLGSQKEFAEYCQRDHQAFSPLLQGYYHPHTNRVVLYESDNNAQTSLPSAISDTVAFSKVNSDEMQPRDTVIHEAIHQLAFNAGLHSRIGKNPRWAVEGLAMMLEVDANRGNAISSIKSRVHKDRLAWFLKYRKSDRTETIADFIANEEVYFTANVLNAYSQAWALTYFLAETRSAEYADYLQRVASRGGLSPVYSPQERLADFQASFGDDLTWLEVQFMRFIDKLE